MRHGVALKRACARRMVNGKDNISNVTASEVSVRDSKLIRNSFLESSENNTKSAENGNEVLQEEEGGRVQKLSSKN